jgi:hypothetical protein
MPNRRQDVPVDASVVVTCPVCDDDNGVTAYVAYGLVDHVRCAAGCHTRYSADERALVEEAAKDAANTELHELEFSHLYRCGADAR